MTYWIKSIKDGSFIDAAKTYEEAMVKQDKLLKEKGIDTYLIREE